MTGYTRDVLRCFLAMNNATATSEAIMAIEPTVTTTATATTTNDPLVSAKQCAGKNRHINLINARRKWDHLVL